MTPTNYDLASFDTLWFAGSGLAIILIGAMTLLAAREAVRVFAVVANLAGLGLPLAFGMLTRWEATQGPILVVLFLMGGTGSWFAGRLAHGVSR